MLGPRLGSLPKAFGIGNVEGFSVGPTGVGREPAHRNMPKHPKGFYVDHRYRVDPRFGNVQAPVVGRYSDPKGITPRQFCANWVEGNGGYHRVFIRADDG